MKQFDTDTEESQLPEGHKPTYIKEQHNNNCQQFFGPIINGTFIMPAAQPSADTAQSKAKGKGGRPRRAGKNINKAFRYEVGDETQTRLQLLFNGLISLGWICRNTDLRSFLNIFSGGETTSRIVWTGDINALTELFQELVTRKQFVQLPQGESIWLMVNARFWDHEGNKEFGNTRLGSTRPPKEAKDSIDLLVKIMNPATSLNEIRKSMQSQ